MFLRTSLTPCAVLQVVYYQTTSAPLKH